DVDANECVRGLEAGRTELCRLTQSRPAGEWLRWLPSQRADGRTRERDALEDPQVAFDHSLHPAGRGIHDGALFGHCQGPRGWGIFGVGRSVSEKAGGRAGEEGENTNRVHGASAPILWLSLRRTRASARK